MLADRPQDPKAGPGFRCPVIVAAPIKEEAA
jgi:hypothetical protein